MTITETSISPWNPNTQYAQNDIVLFLGVVFVARGVNTGYMPVIIDTYHPVSYWENLAGIYGYDIDDTIWIPVRNYA